MNPVNLRGAGRNTAQGRLYIQHDFPSQSVSVKIICTYKIYRPDGGFPVCADQPNISPRWPDGSLVFLPTLSSLEDISSCEVTFGDHDNVVAGSLGMKVNNGLLVLNGI
jgi:hypothetical protein